MMEQFINILCATIGNSRQKTRASQSLKDGFNNFNNCVLKRVFSTSIYILSSCFILIKTAPTMFFLRTIFMRGILLLMTEYRHCCYRHQTWLVVYLSFVLSSTHTNFGRYQYAYSLITLNHTYEFSI